MNFSKGAHNKIYWKCLHVICSCYDALTPEEKSVKVRWGMLGFLKMFAVLVPNKMWSIWMSNFIEMNDTTKQDVLSNKTMNIYYTQNDPQYLEQYVVDNTKTNALEWSWTLHEYINHKRRQNGENIKSLSFGEIKEKYKIKYITKDFWGRPMWFVIHTFALNLPAVLNDQYKNYWKAFASSLQFVLPCPICKEHYKQNMINFNVENYLSTSNKVFEWTWRLHNNVNVSKDYKSNVISFEDAKDIYENSTEEELMMVFL